MNDFVFILVLIVVGALLGGGTNLVAIRMLFRPYRAWHIGKWRVPFTPGLIPKRREEIAVKLGALVEDHLITPEGMQVRLKDGILFSEVEKRLQQGVSELLVEDVTLDDWLSEHLQKKDQLKQLRASVELGIQTTVKEWASDYKHRPLEEFIPVEWRFQAEKYVPLIANTITSKGAEYLGSEEGLKQLEQLMVGYLRSKGSMSSMFGRVATRFSLAAVISRELVLFLQKKETTALIEELIRNELADALKKPPSEFIEEDRMDYYIDKITTAVIGKTPLISEWNQPLKAWSGRYEELLTKTIIPQVMATASLILSRYLETIMKRLGIKQMVEREINAFPLRRLEEILLMIASKELKMIAVLGGLIGGLVGLVQGLLVVFVL
ncbi:DUF445 family protein [Paenalkalicoccus suaedae]|uniref:DUF445 family protein n=1 Tax=Paenalkalicoccus suaedae TaxID=2592382 RepID=A0A859FBK1_9BACI|nr:DUF445 family protein [Paenalkalicoccus suaedae]QKS70733.1 DUF445 family protein [Paenalkalicoccus suaedae]